MDRKGVAKINHAHQHLLADDAAPEPCRPIEGPGLFFFTPGALERAKTGRPVTIDGMILSGRIASKPESQVRSCRGG